MEWSSNSSMDWVFKSIRRLRYGIDQNLKLYSVSQVLICQFSKCKLGAKIFCWWPEGCQLCNFKYENGNLRFYG